MWPSTLTEAEFHVFVERFDSFTAGLTPGERNFVTTILLRACTSQAPEVLGHGLHPDSAIHAHLTYVLWELTRLAEGSIPANALPLPPT
jgi:hypothetical protein